MWRCIAMIQKLIRSMSSHFGIRKRRDTDDSPAIHDLLPHSRQCLWNEWGFGSSTAGAATRDKLMP